MLKKILLLLFILIVGAASMVFAAKSTEDKTKQQDAIANEIKYGICGCGQER